MADTPDVIAVLRQQLPQSFACKSISELTGGLLHPATVQNQKSAGELPPDCFFYHGRTLGILREPFLAAIASKIMSADVPRPAGRNRKVAA